MSSPSPTPATGLPMVAIETATETVGVAVRTAEGVEADFTLTGRRRHVESLFPALQHLLAQVGLEAGDLAAVAVDVGPGLFTGLRVGVAAAKGLAQSLGIEVVALHSTDVLFGAAAEVGTEGLVLAAVDARRGEVFAAVRDLSTRTPQEVVALGLFRPAGLVTALTALGGRAVTAVGDGVQRYADVLRDVGGVTCVTDALSFPPPRTLLSMAVALVQEGAPLVPPEQVVPLYLREADAVSNFARARPA